MRATISVFMSDNSLIYSLRNVIQLISQHHLIRPTKVYLKLWSLQPTRLHHHRLPDVSQELTIFFSIVQTGCARAYSRKTKRISIPHGALGVAELITSRLVPYVGWSRNFDRVVISTFRISSSLRVFMVIFAGALMKLDDLFSMTWLTKGKCFSVTKRVFFQCDAQTV